MTRGARTRRQRDEGAKLWLAPRESGKPSAESERAQRWRLSLASLLFIAVLLSDHLWFCAEAKLTRTRDKANYSRHHHHHTPPHHHPPPPPPPPTTTSPPPPPPPPSPPHAPHSLAMEKNATFLGDSSTKPVLRAATCHPDSLSKDCVTFTDARTVCLGLSAGGDGDAGAEMAYVNLSDLYLSFCNSYSLLDLFHGFTSPGTNCSLYMDTRGGCDTCLEVFQGLDQEAESNYREFELLVTKYETDAYSVRTCMDESLEALEWKQCRDFGKLMIYFVLFLALGTTTTTTTRRDYNHRLPKAETLCG
ncbi:hypothetical protein CRUP_035695 [Coryphaenoides rupestris]|nr:hypothetical protein CRUP_035695 [Coryphaenoides rupestris]